MAATTSKKHSKKRDAARAKAMAISQMEQEATRNLQRRRRTQRAGHVGSSLVHVAVTWLVAAGLLALASKYRTKLPNRVVDSVSNVTLGSNDMDGFVIPTETLSDWTLYPNPLGITDDERAKFHPVVIFPKVWVDNVDDESVTSRKKQKRQKVSNYQILDHTTTAGADQLASEDEREQARRAKRRQTPKIKDYAIGRYDENRVNLYSSELFHDTANDIDGYAGARTVHIGMDLDAPVGTKVYAFTDGVVHSAGYNEDLGDYGNVIVVEHDLGTSDDSQTRPRKLWALYGHLDGRSILNKSNGTKIKKGQVIGRMGDIHENGGWYLSHVHFQLSIHPPETHDMPGVVSMQDRPRALIHYPDPRLVLGPLY